MEKTLIVNLDLKDCLMNSQTVSVSYIQFSQGNVRKVFRKFSDEQADVKTMRSFNLGTQNSSVSVEKTGVEISRKLRLASLFIKCAQFSLTLAGHLLLIRFKFQI